MGIFDTKKSIDAFKIIASGGKAEISEAQIINLIIDLVNSRNRLSTEQRYAIEDIYDEYRKNKTIVLMDKDSYIETESKMIEKLATVAPFELYANEAYLL